MESIYFRHNLQVTAESLFVSFGPQFRSVSLFVLSCLVVGAVSTRNPLQHSFKQQSKVNKVIIPLKIPKLFSEDTEVRKKSYISGLAITGSVPPKTFHLYLIVSLNLALNDKILLVRIFKQENPKLLVSSMLLCFEIVGAQ